MMKHPTQIPVNLQKKIVEIQNHNFNNWKSLIFFLEIHRLQPLFFKGMMRFPGSSIPTEFLTDLEVKYQSVSKYNGVYFEILDEVRGLFKSKIEFILLKGCDLILRIYEDKALRPLDDIDILIRAKDLSRAHFLLSKIGFVEIGTPDEKRHHRVLSRRSYARVHPGLNSPFFVEIHWDLRWMLHHYHTDGAWENFFLLPYQGGLIKGLDQCDLFLYLSLHWLNHWRDKDRLLWAVDLAFLIKKGLVPWETIRDKARENHLFFAFHAVLRRLSYFFDLDVLGVPENLLRENAKFFDARILRFASKYPTFLSLLTCNSAPPDWHEVLNGMRRVLQRRVKQR